LEPAAQGGGGVTIPGRVQKSCRCGTSVYGLVGTASCPGRRWSHHPWTCSKIL